MYLSPEYFLESFCKIFINGVEDILVVLLFNSENNYASTGVGKS